MVQNSVSSVNFEMLFWKTPLRFDCLGAFWLFSENPTSSEAGHPEPHNNCDCPQTFHCHWCWWNFGAWAWSRRWARITLWTAVQTTKSIQGALGETEPSCAWRPGGGTQAEQWGSTRWRTERESDERNENNSLGLPWKCMHMFFPSCLSCDARFLFWACGK